MHTLFSRSGEALAPNFRDERNKPIHIRDRVCWRCGGAGGSEKWRHTGWTCYRCGGSGKDPVRDRIKLYDADQLAKLNDRKAKADAKKAAARAEAARIEQERRDAERAEIISDNQGFLDRIDAELAHGHIDFLQSVRERIVEQAKEPTDVQVQKVNEIIERNEKERARRAAARHVGEIKERRVFELTLLHTQSRLVSEYPHIYSHWSLFTDENGSKIASKSVPHALGLKLEVPEGGKWDDRCYIKGSKVRVKATVVEHTTDKNGEPITYINRPKAA